MLGHLLDGKYELTRLLGQGGMGAVYEATSATAGERVAVKVILQPGEWGARSESLLRRFRREAQATMALDTPHIVRVIEMGVDAATGAPFMVMEYLDGEDLNQLLGRCDPLAPAAALRIVAQACAGVQKAHEARIIHRDIKPANLFLARLGGGTIVVKVLDFGIAKVAMDDVDGREATGLTRTGSMLGSPLYMSPEQARGIKAVDHRTDVWSLGIVLYRALTGRAPHQDIEAFGDLIIALCSEAPQPIQQIAPWVPSQVAAIVTGALRIDPALRFPSAAAMLEAVLALLPDGPALDESMLVAVDVADRAVVSPRPEVAATLSVGDDTVAPSSPAMPVTLPREAVKVRRSAAVLGFKNLSGRAESAWLSVAFSEMLTAEIAASEQVRAVAGDNVSRLKLELSIHEGDALDQGTLENVRGILGADLLVFGSYLAMPRGASTQVRLVVSVQDASAGELCATFADTDTEEGILDLVSRVGAKLRAKLGVHDEAEASPIRPSFPKEPGALQHYAEGLSSLRRFDLPRARDLLEQAVLSAASHPLPHAALAEAWSALGHDAKAQAAAKRAFELSNELRREDRLFVEGRLHQMQKDWEGAIGSYRTLYGFFPDNLDYGLRLAEVQTLGGRGQDAMATVASLRRLPVPASDDARIDLSEAAAAGSISDYRRELDAARRAAEKGVAQGARLLVARALFSQASALVRLGEQPRAAEVCKEARQIFAAARDRAGEARTLNRIANIAYEEGDLVEARRLFLEALVVWREISHGSGVAQALNNVADTSLMQGHLAEAKPLFEEALAAARESGDRHNAVIALSNLSDLVTQQGDLRTGWELGREAVRESRETGYRYGLHAGLSALGNVALAEGDLDGARALYDEALAASRAISDPRLTAYSLFGLGQTALAAGELEEAHRLHEEALRMRDEIGCHLDAAESRLGVAAVLLAAGSPEAAMTAIAPALERFQPRGMREREAHANRLLSAAWLACGRVDEAEDALRAVPDGPDSMENTFFRLEGAITAAEARAARGDAEGAAIELAGARREAAEMRLVPLSYEAELSLLSLEPEPARSEHLRELAERARERGLMLVARKAEERAGLTSVDQERVPRAKTR